MIRRAGGMPVEVALAPPGWRIERAALEAAMSPKTRRDRLQQPAQPDRPAVRCGRAGDAGRDCGAQRPDRHQRRSVGAYAARRPAVHAACLAWRDGRAHDQGRLGRQDLLAHRVEDRLAGRSRELATLAARAHQFLTFASAPNLQAAVAYGLNKAILDPADARALRASTRPDEASGLARRRLCRPAKRLDLFPVRRSRRIRTGRGRRELRHRRRSSRQA